MNWVSVHWGAAVQPQGWSAPPPPSHPYPYPQTLWAQGQLLTLWPGQDVPLVEREAKLWEPLSHPYPSNLVGNIPI